MRLIDADALIKRFECLRDEHETLSISYNALYEVLVAQPTAYDTEKVVAELEKESDFFSGKPMGTLQKAYYCKGIERAIEIVRKGGAE
jgi:hypothetical protein